MDSAKLHDWLQLVGIFALVGSLIFVGLQLKQTQEVALIESTNGYSEQSLNLKGPLPISAYLATLYLWSFVGLL
jgi:hypothetical protein